MSFDAELEFFDSHTPHWLHHIALLYWEDKIVTCDSACRLESRSRFKSPQPGLNVRPLALKGGESRERQDISGCGLISIFLFRWEMNRLTQH